jgi:hypothetical protein
MYIFNTILRILFSCATVQEVAEEGGEEQQRELAIVWRQTFCVSWWYIAKKIKLLNEKPVLMQQECTTVEGRKSHEKGRKP